MQKQIKCGQNRPWATRKRSGKQAMYRTHKPCQDLDTPARNHIHIHIHIHIHVEMHMRMHTHEDARRLTSPLNQLHVPGTAGLG